MRKELIITGDKVKPLIIGLGLNKEADSIYIGSYKGDISEVWSFTISSLVRHNLIKEITEEEANKILTLINLGLNKLEVFDCLKHLMIKE